MSSSIAYKTLSDNDNVDKTSSMIVQITDDDDMRTECSDKKGDCDVESICVKSIYVEDTGMEGSDAEDGDDEGSDTQDSGIKKKEKDNMTTLLLGNEESCSCMDSGNEDLNVSSELNHLASSLSDIRSYCKTWEEASKNTLSVPSCYHDETLNKMNIHDEEDIIQKRTQDRSCFSFLRFIFSIFHFNKKKQKIII